jgi:CRP-like cAMP-binding protein
MTSLLVQKLKRLRFLSGAPEIFLDQLAAYGNLRRFGTSEAIYIQDDEPKAAHLILSGMVNRETTQGGDVAIQLSRAFPGDWLGLANVTSRIVPYMHSAIAADTSEILSFDIHRFTSLRSKEEFSHYLLQVIGKEQLAEEERYLNNISSSRSYDKLILFLAAEMERMQKRGASIIHAPYIFGTQEYFAKAIGMRRETVSRDLQPLIAAGIIERTHGVRPARYTILKQDALSSLASSPLRRSTLYENTRSSKAHRRFSDVA